MKQPNILLIMTDQQRWDCVSCYGNQTIETPNLDWLASEGTMFRSAYSAVPSCIPARASLMSGLNQWNTGLLGMGPGQGDMGIGFKHTLPGELALAGYHTQGVGKMHFYPQRALNGFHNTVLDESSRVEDPGFVSDYRQWFENNKTGNYGYVDHGIDWNSWMARPYHAPEFLHPTNWTVEESFKFMRQRDPSKPFFLKMSFARPHSPYDAPPFYFDLYTKKQLPKPFLGEWSSRHDVPEDAAKPNAWRGVRSEEEIHRARAGYYGNIHFIDHQIGRFLMYFQNFEEEVLNNTWIIFTSDHGDLLGDHNLWRKARAYEGSSHIPLIVKPPKSWGKPNRRTVDEPVTLYDIMPTILEAAGVEIPSGLDGISLLGLMRGEQTEWRDFIHGEHCMGGHEEQEMHYLTNGKMKYVWLSRIGMEQMFDLCADPGETIDLAPLKEHGAELRKWRGRLVSVLEPRNAGFTDGDELVCQSGKPPHISPHFMERIERSGVPVNFD